MNNYKFTIRNIMEKDLNIQEENIDEAIDLFLRITNQTDILENNLEDDENSYFEFDIETDMEKSYCYNPFSYLRNDNDVQKLVTNLFKATTPKGSQSSDPFWDTAASMLLLALIFWYQYYIHNYFNNYFI